MYYEVSRYQPENRLSNKQDFSRVFGQVEYKYSTPEFLLLARSNLRITARLGVVVQKKNVRKAIERNQIKRVIRESFRLNRITLPNWDIVILALRPAVRATNQELFERLSKGWAKLVHQAAKDSTERS